MVQCTKVWRGVFKMVLETNSSTLPFHCSPCIAGIATGR